MRGGPLLGGKRGLYDTFVGETTRYVVTKAPCRVILTAPPGDGRARHVRPSRLERFTPPPTADPMRLPGLTPDEPAGISAPEAAKAPPG